MCVCDDKRLQLLQAIKTAQDRELRTSKLAEVSGLSIKWSINFESVAARSRGIVVLVPSSQIVSFYRVSSDNIAPRGAREHPRTSTMSSFSLLLLRRKFLSDEVSLPPERDCMSGKDF